MIVLDRIASLDDTIVAQAATLHEAGLRVRSLSFFYDEWLGKLPVSELERMSLMFDVGELHRVRYGRVKRLCDLAVGVVGLVAFVAVGPVRASLATWWPTGAPCSSAKPASGGRAGRSRS